MTVKFPKISLSLTICLATILVLDGCTLPAAKKKPVPIGTRPKQPERTPKYSCDGWIVARASLHNHTTYSDGRRDADELLDLAQDQGMAILAYTDHREGKICFGNYMCGDRGGVESVGYDVYYERLRKIQQRALAQDMIALKGVEISPPHLRNHGKFPHLVLLGGVKHFTVYAIEDPRVLENMPTSDRVPLKPEKDYGDEPYEALVDYLDQNGGIVHCVHPDWAPDDWIGPVHNMAIPPVNNARFRGLTGFSALPEGWKVVPRPGGQWDSVLAEYLVGMRDRPLWVSADADYHFGGSLAVATTLFYMNEFTEAEVYKCMREGRMVALQGEAFQDSFVSEWSVAGGDKAQRKVMLGMEVKLDAAPRVRFSLDHPVDGCRTTLIRNGVVVEEVDGTELSFIDNEIGEKKVPAFYRVEVVGPVDDSVPYEDPTMPESLLFVNPIFIGY